MPFRLVNGPVIFVVMVYDLKNYWDKLAKEWDININININIEPNSIIIINNTFIYSNSFETILQYLQAILEISKRYNLSWKLEKYGFLEPQIEFVGVNIADHDNHPAQSKSSLVEMWQNKTPFTIRDLAAFIGFTGYYCNWIPFHETRIKCI